ncbi:MAG: PA domain-containing protein [Gemmatimonadales bacterium]
MTRCLALLTCVATAASAQDPASAARVKRDVSALAADSMAGRFPGTAGGRAATRYIERQLRAAGLEPGAGRSFLQPVPLVARRTLRASLSVERAGVGRPVPLPLDELLVRAGSRDSTVRLDAPLVFVGHGIDAPDLGLNEYRDVAIRGAIALVRAGLPDSLTARLPNGSDDRLGTDEAKIAAARRHGAVAVVLLGRNPTWGDRDLEVPVLRPGWAGVDEPALVAWAGPALHDVLLRHAAAGG